MSSELLEDIDDDENGSSVQLSMNAGGHAFLYANGESKDYYHLVPNEIGWKNAEKIVSAINEWVNHTKSIMESEITPQYRGLVIEKTDHCVLQVGDSQYKLCNHDGSSRRKEPWLYYVGKQITVIGNVNDGNLFSISIGNGGL